MLTQTLRNLIGVWALAHVDDIVTAPRGLRPPGGHRNGVTRLTAASAGVNRSTVPHVL